MEMCVIKRDNRLEDFDREKIVAGIVKAGASREVAEKVAKDVEEDICKTASCCIKDKVIRRLRIENADVAKAFETYKKT